jgi:multidrug efflux pump subunit AcrB
MAVKVLKTEHNADGNIFLRGMKKLIAGSYTRLLEKALQRPILTLFIALGLFVASLSVFGIIGFRLFPTSEKPQFLININMPLQSNLETTDAMARYVEKALHEESQIQYYTTNVGRGNPRIYYNVSQPMKNLTMHSFVQLDAHTSPVDKRQLKNSGKV